MDDPSVVVVFRSGWRQSLDRATSFEVWDRGDHRGTIPADLILRLLMHHLHSLALTEQFRTALSTEPRPKPALEVPAAPRLRRQNGRKLRGR